MTTVTNTNTADPLWGTSKRGADCVGRPTPPEAVAMASAIVARLGDCLPRMGESFDRRRAKFERAQSVIARPMSGLDRFDRVEVRACLWKQLASKAWGSPVWAQAQGFLGAAVSDPTAVVDAAPHKWRGEYLFRPAGIWPSRQQSVRLPAECSPTSRALTFAGHALEKGEEKE